MEVFSHFAVAREVPHVAPANLEISDVFMELRGVTNGALAILFIRDGVIDFLELVTYNDPWPEDPELVALDYWSLRFGNSPDQRDLDALRARWRSRTPGPAQ